MDESTNTCKYWQIYFGNFDDLFDVQVLKEDPENPIKLRRMLSSQFNKKIVSASESQFVLHLEFVNPMEVSPDDFLKVTTNFTSFNPGITMSERRIPCTR